MGPLWDFPYLFSIRLFSCFLLCRNGWTERPSVTRGSGLEPSIVKNGLPAEGVLPSMKWTVNFLLLKLFYLLTILFVNTFVLFICTYRKSTLICDDDNSLLNKLYSPAGQVIWAGSLVPGLIWGGHEHEACSRQSFNRVPAPTPTQVVSLGVTCTIRVCILM